ncbi:MAG: response regulator [Chloracidobacterium sp.]
MSFDLNQDGKLTPRGKLRKLSAASVLLGELRHELRTPLNAIIGYSELLLEDAEENSPLRLELDGIHANSQALLRIVNSTLDAARTDAAGAQPKLQNFGETLYQDTYTLLQDILAHTTQAQVTAAADARPDVEKIHQSAEYLASLIQTFFSLSAFDDDLELADIVAQSRNAPTVERFVADRQATSGEFHGQILVVDDNALNRDLLTLRLAQQRYAVVTARNGREALELVAGGAFDLILLDIMMPELDGFETLRRLKENVISRDIPVIMISAVDEIDSVVRCIEMGAEDYLPKPFSLPLLRARVGTCFEKKRLRDHEKAYLRHVARLTEAAAAVEVGTFSETLLAEVAIRNDELGRLARVFQEMAAEIKAREAVLEMKIRERTAEVEAQRNALAASNTRILDSIRYALRIQQAMLPSLDHIASHVPELFTLYRAKDIVSGDFYWFHTFDDELILAVADCTGHGVPGSLMSIVGMNGLNQIVLQNHVTQPAEILKQLHAHIRAVLKQDRHGGQFEFQLDSMDIGVCHVLKGERRLMFAGARRPLFIVADDGQLAVIPGNRLSVGGRQHARERAFEAFEAPLDANATYYLTTDGFADQPDANGEKFGTPRFRDLLTTLAGQPLETQRTTLEKQFDQLLTFGPQRDDVTVLGFRA